MPSSRTLEKTGDKGIFKRGGRYVVCFRDPDGTQRKRAAATLAEARLIKAGVRTDISRGEYQAPSKLTLKAYYDGWIETYVGRTKGGIRGETIDGYRSQFRLHVLPALGRRRLVEIGPRDIKELAAELTGKGLSANTVRLAVAPLKACLATAFEEEIIRRNPAANVRLAQPSTVDADEAPKVKALTSEELQRLLEQIPEKHRLVVELLAHTGLRIGELAALTWGDIDFGQQRLHVRRRWYRGSFAPPKSKYGKRYVPLTKAMAQRLWTIRGRDDELLFGTRNGTPMSVTNYYNRVFKPAARRAGLPDASYHTLRHSCASALFNKGGLNAKQVQAWLGHHSPAFTMATYVHMLADDLTEAPAALDALFQGATDGQPDPQKAAETVDAANDEIPSPQAVSARSA